MSNDNAIYSRKEQGITSVEEEVVSFLSQTWFIYISNMKDLKIIFVKLH